MKRTLLTLAACATLSISAFAADEVVGLNESFTSGIPSNWTNVKVSGDKEFYGTSFTNKETSETTYYAAMTGYKGTQPPYNAWLISPAVNIDNATSKTLTFRTQVNGYGNQNSTFKAYVLTSNDPESATTTELSATFAVAPESGYSSWVESGNLDLSSYKGVIYIGFNYVAPEEANYSTWCVTDVKLNADNATKPEEPASDKGTLSNPLTVAELLANDCPAKDAGEAGWFVKGYIVGYVPGMAMSETVFGPAASADAQQTNIVIGGSSAEDEIEACVPVQLPKGSVRDGLNLVQNPDNLGKCVILQGTYEKYFSVAGLKSVVSYQFVEDGGSTTDPDPVTPPATGDAIYEGLSASCDWTFEDTTLPEGLTYVWLWKESDQYGNYLNGSAFNKEAFAAESWAISPVVDLTGVEEATVTFEHAAKFQTTLRDLCGFYVREENGDWKKAEITWPEAGAWTWSSAGDIDLKDFVGKKAQFAFKYESSAEGADTWEVRNFVVKGGKSGIETVETEEAEAVYYNLQGVRVINPENGLYIERRGNKARKVVIK